MTNPSPDFFSARHRLPTHLVVECWQDFAESCAVYHHRGSAAGTLQRSIEYAARPSVPHEIASRAPTVPAAPASALSCVDCDPMWPAEMQFVVLWRVLPAVRATAPRGNACAVCSRNEGRSAHRFVTALRQSHPATSPSDAVPR